MTHNAEGIWQGADHIRALNQQYGLRGPVAIVVADVVRHAHSKMYAAASNRRSHEVRVFRTIAEAEAWLESIRERNTELSQDRTA